MTGLSSDPADLVTQLAWARRLARDLVSPADADDICQETWLRTVQARVQVREPRAWLTTVIRNIGRSRIRSEERRHAREKAGPAVEAIPTPEESLARLELHRVLAALVARLEEPFRQTLLLRYFDELSAAQIARRLSVPAGTVRWRIKTGIERLRAELQRRVPDWRRAWAPMVLPASSAGRAALAWVTKGAALLVVASTLVVVGWRSTGQLPADLPPAEHLHVSPTVRLPPPRLAQAAMPPATSDEGVVPYERIPLHLVAAVVAAEDGSFFQHEGLDFTSVGRAAIVNLRDGGYRQGGATITQQLARLLVGSERSLTRKVREVLVARELERRYSKTEILTLYLNRVFFGHGSFGVAAAARRILAKDLSELDVGDCALLAGMVRAPVRTSPLNHPAAARARRNQVLALMAEMGALDREEAERWKARPVVTSARESTLR